MTTLFIYGTLKRGQAAHHMLAGQRFQGAGRTMPMYRIVDLGPHPALVIDTSNGLAVHGELWIVNDECLKVLDAYEGAPTYYTLQPITIADHDGDVMAYFKVAPPPPAGLPTGDRWPLER